MTEEEMIKQGRDWVADAFEMEVTAYTLPDHLIKRGIQRHYEGGWSQFVADIDH